MDFLKLAVIIAFVILTVFTVKHPPTMHQPMILEDQDFVLTRISDTINVDKAPVTIVNNTSEQTVVTREDAKKTIQALENMVNNPKSERVVIVREQPTETKVVKQQTSPVSESQMELLQRIISNAENAKVVEQPAKTKVVEQPKPITKPQEQQKPVEKTTTQTKTVQTTTPSSGNPKNPYMTEQEEIIAWNIWRSNIQNQIMRDSNIDFAPLGTVFTFTFIVDKFGNVSNIKVECSHPSFMDVARNNVKPAISRLQKKPILNFPRGTQRTSTVVTGLFVIGTQERYSTPGDFSDYETVRR